MSTPSFFHTQQQSPISPKETHQLVKKKIQLGSYVSNLDHHINKAMNFQNRAINQKKQSLLHTLQKMKDQVFKQSQKYRKIQQFFYHNCEKILKENITRWEDNKEFFKQLFEFHDKKIKQKKCQIADQKKVVEQKTRQLKQLMRLNRKPDPYTKISLTIASTQRTTQLLRVKTETSLPSISNRQTRLKTFTSEEQTEIKNYMKPIKTQKKVQKSSYKEQLYQILSWYREKRLKQKQDNWFEKVLFVERNFKKIQAHLQNHKGDTSFII